MISICLDDFFFYFSVSLISLIFLHAQVIWPLFHTDFSEKQWYAIAEFVRILIKYFGNFF